MTQCFEEEHSAIRQDRSGAHLLSVVPDGTLMPGTRVRSSGSVLLLRPKK